MITLIAPILTLIGSALSAYTDAKTGYIYDWITYPLIGIGIILTLFQPTWVGIPFAIVIYGIGYIANNRGSIGGGDVKLLTGITLLQPVYAGSIFVLHVLMIACIGMTINQYVLNNPSKRFGPFIFGGVLISYLLPLIHPSSWLGLPLIAGIRSYTLGF